MKHWLRRRWYMHFRPRDFACPFCADTVKVWRRPTPYGGYMDQCKCTFCGAEGYGSNGHWWAYQ